MRLRLQRCLKGSAQRIYCRKPGAFTWSAAPSPGPVTGKAPSTSTWKPRRSETASITWPNGFPRYIEDEYGYYAICVPPGTDSGNRPFVSFAKAAELAGCGTPSLAGPVLNPEYGFMYYSVLISTLPLEADRPLVEPVCPAPECVDMWEESGTTPCMATCPIDEGGCLGGRLENGRITERRYDVARCSSRVETSWVPGFQKVLDKTLKEKDKEQQKLMLYSSLFTRTLWSMTYANVSQGQCFECMRVCPVGSKHRLKQ